MKHIAIGQASLENCVDDAQRGNILVTRDGEPVAIIVGVAGMGKEQIELGSSSKFWSLIAERRRSAAKSSSNGSPKRDRERGKSGGEKKKRSCSL